MKKMEIKKLLEIYITFYKLGSISFGGGYSMIPLIEREVVESKKWVKHEKLIDIFAVSESLPGAIALNSSAFVGYAVAGVPGALSALIGNMTPSAIIVLILSIFFQKISDVPIVQAALNGITPAIIALIAYAAYKIGKTAIQDVVTLMIAFLAFISVLVFHMTPIIVVIIGALIGVIMAAIGMKNATLIDHDVEKEEIH